MAAYSERPLERFGRWLRQHRTLTYAVAAALVGVTIVATAAAVLIDGGRRRETAARKEAESNFDMAQQAVDDYLTRVSENTLLKEQDSVDIRGLRRELLENALRYYKRFVSRRNDDPFLRRRLATAYFRVGQITSDIGSAQDAIAAYRSAEGIWEAEAAANPDDDELKKWLADCHLAIGIRQAALGALQEAMTSFRQARSLLERVTTHHPSNPADMARLANCYAEIGILQGSLESDDHGLANLEKAKEIQQQLIGQGPADFARRQRLAELINALGFVQFKRHDLTAAARTFEEVQKVCVSLLDEITDRPKPVRILSLLAVSHYNIATMVVDKDKEKALQEFEKSLEYRRALVDSHQSVSVFRENLANSYREVAIQEHGAGQSEIAILNLNKALDLFEKLIPAEPEQARYHAGLGRTLNALGWIYDERQENQKAIPMFERAVREQQYAVARSPQDNEYKIYLCNHLENLGEQYLDLGDVSHAWPYENQALAIYRKLNADHPKEAAYAQMTAEALCRLGSIKRQVGDPAAAVEWFAEARHVAEQFLKTTPDQPAIRGRLAQAFTREAWAQFDLKDTASALRSLDQAKLALEPLSKPSERGADFRARLTETLQARALILRSMNENAGAGKADAERMALWDGQPALELANLALVQATRAALIGYGKGPADGQPSPAAKIDLDLGATNLKLAIERGFTDLSVLRSQPQARHLLERDDIKPLIDRLPSRTPTPAAQPPE